MFERPTQANDKIPQIDVADGSLSNLRKYAARSWI